jgi:thioredoxin 2
MSESLRIRCKDCGAINRVPPEKVERGLEPVCGRCKKALSVDGKPVNVTDATFTAEVAHSRLPVLLDVWAPWCGPCRFLTPIVDDLASELAGRMRVAKLNVDQNPVTASRFNIQNIPALLVLKGGREVGRIIGVQPKSEILRKLQTMIA